MSRLDLAVLLCVSLGLCCRTTASCGGSPKEEGVIAFPGNTNVSSGSNVHCEWRLSASPGEAIRLFFRVLNVNYTQESNNYVEVRERRSNYRWYNVLHYKEEYVSKESSIVLVVHSDDSTTDTKFVVNWQSLPVFRGCGGSSSSPQGTIQFESPLDNSDCSFALTTTGYRFFKLTFTLFALEDSKDCSKDYLEIVDGSKSAGKWCGKNAPGTDQVYISDMSNIRLDFHSDANMDSQGFKVTWETIQDDLFCGCKLCGGQFSASQGAIAFPEKGMTYEDNADCFWRIPIKMDFLKVTFYYFDIENHADCAKDYLQIQEPEDNNVTPPRKWCGRDPPGRKSVHYYRKNVGINEIFIQFHSDDAVTKSGFYLTWENLPIITGCGGVSNENEGVIYFPGTPEKNYANNLDCSWVINTDMGNVMVTFLSMYIQDDPTCSKDYLEIENIGKKLCGSQASAPMEVYYTNSKKLLLKFHSDASETNLGFYSSWKAMPKVPGCGGRYEADKGAITFYDWTNSEVTCVWDFKTTPDKVFRFTFIALHIQTPDNCANSYLELKENLISTGKWCGPELPGSKGEFLSGIEEVDLVYQSDGFVKSPKFRVNWETVHLLKGCTASSNLDQGAILFPGHPFQDYQNNLDCSWKLSTESKKILKFTFTMFDIESSNSCINDYLEIKDGSTGAERWCGVMPNNTKGEYLSLTNNVEIKFHSDAQVTRPGFHMYWQKAELLQGCPNVTGSVNGDVGMIAFPDTKYTTYDNNLNCRWMFVASRGNAIQFTFTHFDIEQSANCSKDYFQIHGERRTCGTDAPGSNNVYTTTGSHAILLFISDDSVTNTGFRLTWKTVPNPQG